MKRMGRIVVPVSGTSADEDAIELACVVARRENAQVEAIHVIQVSRSLPLDADLQDEAERGEDLLEQASRRASKLDVSIETSLLQARDVGAAIVDEAVQFRADAIVMGVPYRRKFGEYELGAVANYVLRNAPCRVWLTRDAMGL